MIAPALTGAAPDDRLSTNLVSSDPVEGFFLNIRMIVIFDKEVRSVFAKSRGACYQGILFDKLARHPTAMREFPGVKIHRGIILDMLNISAAFKYERSGAFLAKFFGCPTSANTRAYDDGVV